MKRVLCPVLPVAGRSVELPESEAVHAVRVLRLRDGDQVEALDGQGKSALVTLRVRKETVRLEYAGESQILRTASAGELSPVTLEIAVLKGDAMEWVVEKAVELGVKTLIPLLTAHTVVQMKNKGPEVFQQRWQKIADQALKQCGRLEKLRIELPMSLEDLLSRHPAKAEEPRLWCDEAARQSAAGLLNLNFKAVRLLIGPEGGWSESERELLLRTGGPGTRPVSLGPLVLRAETAALFAVSVATAALRKLDTEPQTSERSSATP
jgi:16S rRNA (uracil1498-N3)-methyltransferase